MMMASDWLQGPYVYALYSSYGFSKKEIGQLFIMGYGAAAIVGASVGSIADKYGRRLCCVAFTIIYASSCVTKHSPDFWVLMFGRLLGGIGTSLLHSVFESWMIASHFAQGFSGDHLSDTFTKAYFGNYLVAIMAGLFGSMATEAYGPVAPFDIALVMLGAGAFVVSLTWTENYGDSQAPLSTALATGYRHLISKRQIWLVGAAQALFESSMYTFVFMWTPELEEARGDKLPHGLIFAIFMVSCMIGSNCIKLLTRWRPPYKYMIWVFLTAAMSLMPCVFQLGFEARLFGFCVFEACVGVYFPTWGRLRCGVVPEESRATIMNFFRVPLNLAVVVMMSNVHSLPSTVVFGISAGGLLIAAGCQVVLARLLAEEEKGEDSVADSDPDEVATEVALHAMRVDTEIAT